MNTAPIEKNAPEKRSARRLWLYRIRLGIRAWRSSRKAHRRLNFTSRQLLMMVRELRVWLRVFNNVRRVERSTFKALKRMLLFFKGHPRKRLERR